MTDPRPFAEWHQLDAADRREAQQLLRDYQAARRTFNHRAAWFLAGLMLGIAVMATLELASA